MTRLNKFTTKASEICNTTYVYLDRTTTASYNEFYDILHALCIYALLFVTGRCGGLVVEVGGSEREVGGSILTQVAVLYP